MQLFKDTFGHTDPNSTDVHAVYKVKNIAAYISKYMSKDADKATTIKGVLGLVITSFHAILNRAFLWIVIRATLFFVR